MGHLLYSSNEMFSSTNLIRQSKQIFDKLNTKDITKAVILRDGKPSFIMLDFDNYEKMMADYNMLKENSLKSKQNKQHTKTQTTVQNTIINENSSIEKTTVIDNPVSTISDEFEVDLKDDFEEEQNGEIKDFWNK
jgi:hypothetical protein